MKNKLVWVGLLVFVFSLLTISPVKAVGGMVFYPTKQTSLPYSVYYPRFQKAGLKLYLVYQSTDGTNYLLYTAEMNTDGTNFVPTLRRTYSTAVASYVDFAIAGSKMYLVWEEKDGANIGQIWTGEMNLDGTGFTAVQRTFNLVSSVRYPRLAVDGSNIYYVWMGESTDNFMSAKMNIDGTGFVATQLKSTRVLYPQLKVDGGKIYYFWMDGLNSQVVMTGNMNIDGTGYVETNQMEYPTDIRGDYPSMVIDGTKIYLFWTEHGSIFSPHHEKIWYASMNKDGTDFSSHMVWETPNDVPAVSTMAGTMAIYSSKAYFSWMEYDNSSVPQLMTAEMNLDGSNFAPISRKSMQLQSSLSIYYIYPQLIIDDPYIYYVWGDESSNTKNQIWTGLETNTEMFSDSSTVTATVPSSLTFTVAGVSSGVACANSGGNASVTSTSAAIPFGTYTGAQTKIACQTLTVSTNAGSGYVVSLQQNQDLTNAAANVMEKFTGTYTTPTVWSSPISPTKSFFGFTTDDTDLTNFQTAKYSQLAVNNTPYTIMQATNSVANEVNVISYQLEVNNLQEAGVYSNTLMYIVTGMF